MIGLNQEKCTACRSDSPSVNPEEIAVLHPQVSEWDLVTENGVPRLDRTFKFRNFRQALEFTNRVGALAEEQGHHPLLVTEWGRARVAWWTHKIRNLHRNDFVMAAKTDRLYDEMTGVFPSP